MKIGSRLYLGMLLFFLMFIPGGCWDGWSSDKGDTHSRINNDGGDPVDPGDPGPVNPVLPVLKSLVMAAGDMTPSFTGACHDYELSLAHDAVSVSVSIETEDVNQVIVNGSQFGVADFPREVTWDSGNRIIVKVLSSSQAESEYRINVIFKPVIEPEPPVALSWHHANQFAVPYGPGAMLCDDQGRLYVHMGHKLYRYVDGQPDQTYGTGGTSAALTSSGSDNVSICMDKEGNVYVPTGSGGNVEKVLPSGIVETLFRAGDESPLDMGTIRAVVLNGAGTFMWLVQSDGGDARIRGILRMEQQNGTWSISDGKDGRALWGTGGTVSAKEFNSNMRCLVLAGDYLYLGLGSSSRRVYRIDMAGTSIAPVVDLSSSGENTGETGSCGFLCADSNGNVYVPVLRDASGEYTEIRIYRFDGSNDIKTGVISGSSSETSIPGNSSGIHLGGFSVSSDGLSLWFGRSDETVHCLKLE